MKLLGGAIILIIVVWLYVAVSYLAKHKGGSCGGCSGDCSHCGQSSCNTKADQSGVGGKEANNHK